MCSQECVGKWKDFKKQTSKEVSFSPLLSFKRYIFRFCFLCCFLIYMESHCPNSLIPNFEWNSYIWILYELWVRKLVTFLMWSLINYQLSAVDVSINKLLLSAVDVSIDELHDALSSRCEHWWSICYQQ